MKNTHPPIIQNTSFSFQKPIAHHGKESPRIAPTKEECSYCSACQTVCPTKAISYETDKEGFLYPRIDYSKCIHCGMCDQVCEYVQKSFINCGTLKRAFALKNVNDIERTSSRSGGLFFLVSKIIIADGGVIYGAIIDKDNIVKHVRAETIETVQQMQKSKYVQSNLGKIFPFVINDLKSGRIVFFAGTPCIINGLKNLLTVMKVDTGRFYTMDIMCHGTPSPMIFADYIEKIKDKYGAIHSFEFRDKAMGWKNHFESFENSNNQRFFSSDYADLFYSRVAFRPACYNCLFANLRRPGDITGADLWGGEKLTGFFDEKGVSLVMVNDEKGEDLISKIANQATMVNINIADFLQGNMIRPTAKPKVRDSFWRIYERRGYSAFERKAIASHKKGKRVTQLKARIIKIMRFLKLKKKEPLHKHE